MKKLIIILILGVATTLLTNCGQISSEVAKEVVKEALDGRYNGQATYFFRYSQLNLGLEDEKKSEECFAMVFSKAKSPSIVITSLPDHDVININITGFKLLSNGSSFNVVEQVIYSNKTPIDIIGNPIVTDTDGSKSDGYIDDQKKLTFSYTGILNVIDSGYEFSVPFEAYYELSKK